MEAPQGLISQHQPKNIYAAMHKTRYLDTAPPLRTCKTLWNRRLTGIARARTNENARPWFEAWPGEKFAEGAWAAPRAKSTGPEGAGRAVTPRPARPREQTRVPMRRNKPTGRRPRIQGHLSARMQLLGLRRMRPESLGAATSHDHVGQADGHAHINRAAQPENDTGGPSSQAN